MASVDPISREVFRIPLFLVIGLSTTFAATPIPLWTHGAPGAKGDRPEDVPAITPFLPAEDKATGSAFVICPGGGYERLAAHEGEGYARWLNEHGIAAFVLRYRLGSEGYRHPSMLEDVERAIRFVRDHATQWKIDPSRIGVMGSSAGGHLASTALTHFDAGDPNASDPVDRVSSRPDLGVLCYPVIAMTGPLTHEGSKKNLLGENPDASVAASLSSERQVREDTPPCFIWSSQEDSVVDVGNSLAFALALREKHIPFDLHIYQKGRHGIGLGRTESSDRLHPWTDDLLFWLRENGFLNK